MDNELPDIDTDVEPRDVFDDFDEVMRRARLAVREVLRDHQIAGNPVAVWRDNRVVVALPDTLRKAQSPDDGDETSA
jgi:hypothetical protein